MQFPPLFRSLVPLNPNPFQCPILSPTLCLCSLPSVTHLSAPYSLSNTLSLFSPQCETPFSALFSLQHSVSVLSPVWDTFQRPILCTTLCLCSLPSVTHQVSHSYKSTGKTTVLYIWIFIPVCGQQTGTQNIPDRTPAGIPWIQSDLTIYSTQFVMLASFINIQISSHFQKTCLYNVVTLYFSCKVAGRKYRDVIEMFVLPFNNHH